MPQPAILKPTTDFINAIACVLGDAAKAIRKFGIAAHNRCPWVTYVNKAGRICSHFVSRAKFSGYDFKFGNGGAVVTNLETGARYSVLLGNTPWCSCKAFKYSEFPKGCKHIKMIAELQGNLKQAIAPEYGGIDEKDLPKGCSLQRTEDYLSREFYVMAWTMQWVDGILKPTTKCVGRIIEGSNGIIQAYRMKSGVFGRFTRTLDAVKYLVSSSDHSLTEVAQAIDAWDLALDF